MTVFDMFVRIKNALVTHAITVKHLLNCSVTTKYREEKYLFSVELFFWSEDGLNIAIQPALRKTVQKVEISRIFTISNNRLAETV